MIIKNCKVIYLDRIEASMKVIKEAKLKGTAGAVFEKLVFGNYPRTKKGNYCFNTVIAFLLY